MPGASKQESRPRTDFTETQWSLIAAAGDQSSPRAAAALDALCEAYWLPVYAYVRRRGYSAHDAEDMTQGFFKRLIEDNSFARADREKGKFRSYLLGGINHFLADEYDKKLTIKRGGQHVIQSLEQAEEKYNQVASSDTTPEKAFDRRFGLVLLERAVKRLHDEVRASKKEPSFRLLKKFLTNEPNPGDYEKVARKLVVPLDRVPVLVFRLRKEFSQAVRAELAQTVSRKADLEEELRHLFFD